MKKHETGGERMSHKDFEIYGVYPQLTLNPKERELKIAKVKRMRKAHSKILNVLNRSGLTYKEIKKILDLISKEADSILNNSKEADTKLDPLKGILRDHFLYLLEKSKEKNITPEQLALLSKTACEWLEVMKYLV